MQHSFSRPPLILTSFGSAIYRRQSPNPPQEKPEIFNSDQGSQFTSEDFTSRLKNAGIRISMDGRGRVFDNIFVERLWRTVKYKEVYLKDYESIAFGIASLGAYFAFYNHERLHQALGYRTPVSINGGSR